MPRRPSMHFGTSTSPHTSSHTVNEVVSAISRKLTSSHFEHAPFPLSPSTRRPSLSMDSILHPKEERESKRSDSKDRDKGHDKHDKRMSKLRGKSKDRSSH